jgi:hypothetical protein
MAVIHGREERCALMPSSLVVTGEDPVALDGSIDSSNALQMKHGQDSLVDYNQTLHAKHADLRSSSETIQIKLVDFQHGGASWQVTASHDDGGTPVVWTRTSGHAYSDFGAMTDLLEVDVTATSNAAPPQTKTRKMWFKTTPVDGQPDRP